MGKFLVKVKWIIYYYYDANLLLTSKLLLAQWCTMPWTVVGFLSLSELSDSKGNHETSSSSLPLSILEQVVLFGRKVMDWIRNQDHFELKYVLGQLTGKLTVEHFQMTLQKAPAIQQQQQERQWRGPQQRQQSCQQQNQQPVEQAKELSNTTVTVSKILVPIQCLIDTVEAMVTTKEKEQIQLPKTVNLFVQEAIFWPNPSATNNNNNKTGVKLATWAFYNVSLDTPVC